MIKNYRWSLALLTSFLLAGCVHNPNTDLVAAEIGQPSITQMSDEADTQIAEAAASVSQSMTNLEAVEKANMAPQAKKIYPYVAEMQIPGVSSVDWNGPIEPLVKHLAQTAGYRVKIVGSAPITPIIVTVHAEEDSNANILRSAALQANNRAMIMTNAQDKSITLRYLRS
jgi:defect-in-organelle-trafficking protein DotD